MKINHKYRRYSLLITEDILLPHLPETKLFDKDNFHHFLNKYKTIYIHPCIEGYISIMITSHENNLYEISSGKIKKIVDGIENAYTFIRTTFINEEKYIIQQGVPRAKIDGSDFDFRVFVVKTDEGWKIGEKIGRIVQESYLLVDHPRDLFLFQDILHKVLTENGFPQEVITEIDLLAIRTADKMGNAHPKYDLVIVDFLIDVTGKPWIYETKYKLAKGKWDMHHILRGETELYPYLPETNAFHEKLLEEQLEKHKKILIKPCLSQWGYGIAIISALPNGSFEVHYERRKIPFENKNEMFNYLHEEIIANYDFLIQEVIPLARINDSPFDVRVMVQRKSVSSEWEITGKVTRTAADGYIVTNVAQALLPLEEAIKYSAITVKNTASLNWEINQMGLLIAKQLEKVFPSSLMWGLDIGIDQEGKPWFIEANLVPDISLFRYLNDKTMFYKIKEFIREGKKQTE